MANLLLSVMGAFAEFERALIRERNLKASSLPSGEASTEDGIVHSIRMRRRSCFTVHLPGSKSRLAEEYGISRQSLYRSLRDAEDRQQPSGGRRTGTESPDTLPVAGHRPSSGAKDPETTR